MGRWGAGVCFDTLIPQPSLALCGDLRWEERGMERVREREREKEEGGLKRGGVCCVGFEKGRGVMGRGE